MRKILLSMLCLAGTLLTAQELEITPNGLKEKGTDKNFVVIEAEGKTASELYNSAIKYINMMYKNPKEVIKGDVQNEFLKWETFVPSIGTIKNSGTKHDADAMITVQLSFKDGKVKYEVVDTDIYMSSNRNFKVAFKGKGLNYYFYNEKKGNLKQDLLKQGVEFYFNNQIKKLKDSFTGNAEKSNNDW